MLLSTLCEDITDYLNADKSWSINDMPAKHELDPQACLTDKLGVYIIPVVPEYLIGPSSGRRQLIVIEENFIVNMIVSRGFLNLPNSDGVVPWSEAKVLIDTRQKVERAIITFTNPDLKLVNVDTLELAEIELDHRNFVAMSSFTYSSRACV